jgi:hypothetical protein
MLVAVFAAALAAACGRSPTSAVESQRSARDAAFDEAPPPPSANTNGGIGGMGSGT